MDRGPPVKPPPHIKGHAVRVQNVLEDAGEGVLFEPHLNPEGLAGPRVAAVRGSGRCRKVVESVPYADVPGATQPILDLFPRDSSVTPRRYESLRDRLVGAASVFDDLSRKRAGRTPDGPSAGNGRPGSRSRPRSAWWFSCDGPSHSTPGRAYRSFPAGGGSPSALSPALASLRQRSP